VFSEQTLFEKAEKAFAPLEKPYESSLSAGEGHKCFMVLTKHGDALLIQGTGSFFDELEGKTSGDLKLCPLSHTNRLTVNRHIPWTAPSAVSHNRITFGFGDRLGLVNTAHLLSAEKAGIIPVLAQQSMRELKLTGRTYNDVLDAASWAVLRTGWKKGYGADGDHLKTKDEIRNALDCGFTMITLDCSEHLEKIPSDAKKLENAYETLDASVRQEYEKFYLASPSYDELCGTFDKPSLMRAALMYHKALDFITEVYNEFIKPAGRPLDYEISIDETSEKTELTGHVFVAGELTRRGVKISSLAPRFVGEFQKGIDYIGDIDSFTRELRAHCAVARYFGYKISVHSGSDKYSVFKTIARETQGHFHIKTSGTSWLAAVKTIAANAPALYRRMHQCALDNFNEAGKFYVVHCDPSKVAPLSSVSDGSLPAYMEQDDARQLLHIAYGFILGSEKLRQNLFETLEKYKNEYDKEIFSLMDRHLVPLTGK
jgi:hypothetical protein